MQVPQYVLPKVGVSTNEIQLKLNQQKLLQYFFTYPRQNYSKNLTKQLSQKRNPDPDPIFRNQLSDLNPFKSDDPQDHFNSYLNRSLSQSHINKNIHAQIIKNSLSNELSQQIALKEQLKKYKKKQEITLQQEIISHNKLLQNNQSLKQKNFKQIFKLQALKNTELKQLKKKSERQYEKLQKKTFDEMYRKNHEIVQKRILGIENPQPNVAQRKRVSQSQLADYVFNPEIGILPKISMHKPNRQESTKMRENLKQTLIEQMKFNSQKKRMNREKQWNTPFIDEKFKNLDNPITNPIDIKIAKDNKYLMKQLLGAKVTMGKGGNGFVNQKQSPRGSQISMNQGSYLSRRGSNSLSKLGSVA